MNNKPGRRRRNGQQIVQFRKDFEQSGVSAKEFCLIHQIHPNNFHKWKSRYKGKAAKNVKSSVFASVDIIDHSPASTSNFFCEVKGAKICQPVSASFLKELIR